jgi:hypothetical protein
LIEELKEEVTQLLLALQQMVVVLAGVKRIQQMVMTLMVALVEVETPHVVRKVKQQALGLVLMAVKVSIIPREVGLVEVVVAQEVLGVMPPLESEELAALDLAQQSQDQLSSMQRVVVDQVKQTAQEPVGHLE